MTRTRIAPLLDRYDGLLIDGYGVLVDAEGPLPHAQAFIDRLLAERRPFLVLSNDASRLPETSLRRYRDLGFELSREHVLTSGMLLPDHFAASGLVGQGCYVLGPDDAHRQVEAAGGVLASLQDNPRVLVVADDEGYPFLPTIERVLGWLYARLDRGEPVDLVVPNPDVAYPKRPGEIGLTAGAVALLIDGALRVRFGRATPAFVGLGKPHRPMFDRAEQALGVPKGRLLMIGDQLGTDVAGALAAGIDAALVGTGLADIDALPPEGPQPTWTLRDLGD